MYMEKKCSIEIKKYGLVFLLHFIPAMIIFGSILALNKGIYIISTDYDYQQLPFYYFMNNAIKKGEIFWNWTIDLGSDFIPSMSWYNLGSPFFLFSLFLPAESYIYLMPWIFMIKYGVAGLTSYLYIERFVQNKYIVLLSSFLYTFSGFQSINILFNHFHDTVALFPLLLLGIEKITEDKKKGYLLFAVAINALTNYYFFIQEVIFIILYYFIKNGFKRFNSMLQCLVEGIIGVGCASIIFIPSIAFTLNNPRISELISFDQWFDFGRRYILQLFRVFFFPGETMGMQSCVYTGNWSSWSAYLPMISMSFVILFFINKKWMWLHRFLILLFLMVYFPILNSIFTMFSNLLHYRWYFMLILMMALASGISLEKTNIVKLRVVTWITVIIMILSVIGFIWWNENKFELIYNDNNYKFITMLGVLSVFITAILVSVIKKKEMMAIYLTVGAIVIGGFNIWHNYFGYKNNLGEDTQQYYREMKLYQLIEEKDDKYRFSTVDNKSIFFGNISGAGTWHSTVEGSIYHFWNKIGNGRAAHSPEVSDTLQKLLSVGYDIKREVKEVDDIVQEIEKGEEKLYITQRKDALPIGFTYDYYITEEEYDKIPQQDKVIRMFQALVIPEEKEEEISYYLDKIDLNKDYPMSEIISNHAKESSIAFEKSRIGFNSKIITEDEGYAFFSVPFSKYWKVKVNGMNEEVINCNGMMAVKLFEGENNIEFTYHNTITTISLVITIFSLFASFKYIKRKYVVN